ncbi:MFS transporter, sugar porter (SP) family [Burkholderia sp. GAS332]|nr:MFS transporter, sugar porter (SP) family [Burkholderia sp. GAS332]
MIFDMPVKIRSRRAWIVYIFGALGGILLGYDTGVIAGALLFIRRDMALSPQLQGLVVGGILFGAMIGAFGTGRLAERFGPRKMLITAGLMFFVTALLAATAPTPITLIVARVLVGVSVGISSVQVPLYLSEVAPTHIRGGLASLNQLAIATGIFISYVVCYLLSFSGQWRWMLGLATIPALLLTVGMLSQPDSPRWLVRRGRTVEALHVLQITHTEDDASSALAEIQKVSGQPQVKFMEILGSKALRPTLISVFGLAILQQLLGINTVVFYAPTILRSAGFGESAALLNSVGLGFLSITMTILAARIVDRVGRRPLLICGALVMCASMLALAWVFFANNLSQGIGRMVAVCALATFKAAFSFSWGPLVWVLMPELLPLGIRAKILSKAAFCIFSTNFIVASLFPTLLQAGATTAFGLFAGCCFIACCFAVFQLKETARLSLEEIERRTMSG